MLELAGVIAIDTRVAGVTVRVALLVVVSLDIAPRLAEMVVTPEPMAVAVPGNLVPLLMVATPLDEELQVTVVVRSRTELSENIPVAANCWV